MSDALGDVLTPEEVAEKLKISTYTVRRLLKEKKLRGIKVAGGRYWRVRKTDFEDYLGNLSSGDYQSTELSPGMEAAFLSEAALCKEWLTPEEDAYWAHL